MQHVGGLYVYVCIFLTWHSELLQPDQRGAELHVVFVCSLNLALSTGNRFGRKFHLQMIVLNTEAYWLHSN